MARLPLAHASRLPTLLTSLSNTVVLIGGARRLEYVAGHAALGASGAALEQTDVSHAATVCTEKRPYAIIVPKDVYEFGGSEFDALARDVAAGLVIVPEGVGIPVLTALLQEEAFRLG
ncbi:MAG: hypothetical protein HOW73_06595 [Polyangiaceae bacterium]|nr:hypothetical protein [Polyangiaceae bacterium]